MNVLRCPIHDFPVSSICPSCTDAASNRDRRATAARAKAKLGRRLTKKLRKRRKE